jgi:DNA repair photolyase
MDEPVQPIRGRGASANLQNRFEKLGYAVDPDAETPPEAGRPATQFYRDASKSIIAYNDSPDVGFDASINPYRGCEHGCAYCYARPTHEYLGWSAGLDFESRIMVKEDAPELLRRELSSKKWEPQVLAISGVTDCYQPIERKLRLTRRILEVLAEFRNPCVIITKNRLVARDIDVLQELARHHCVAVFVSVTTLDLSLNRLLEPRTSSPEQRLETIGQLADAGVPVGTLVAPIIPGLTDHEIAPIIQAVARAGGKFAGYVVLRLPWAVAPLFEQWLEQHFPDRKEKVLNRIREIRGGGLNKSEFGERMKGQGIFAEQIESMFTVACRKAGILGRSPELGTENFARPTYVGDQFDLFNENA